MNDNLKLSKRKREYRDREYKKCEMMPMEDNQEFIGGRKVVLLYPSNKIAEDGYVDAEWIQRVEIHHLDMKGGCKTYFDERQHDAIMPSRNWKNGKLAPTIGTVKIQRDGATQLVIEDDFYYSNYSAAELVRL